MPTSPLASFQTHFADIEDPRVERTRRYELLDIIVIAVCAVTRTHRPTARQSNAPAGGWCGVCSADDWVDVTAWGQAKLDWLRQYLPLPNGTRSASHDTFGDVFGRLKP
jgi:DDE family transposase